MKRSESMVIRLWALALVLAVALTTLLVLSINPFEVSLAYLGLLAAELAVGLMTNVWGGVTASAVCVFLIVLTNQYAGIYSRENRIINISSELLLFLAIGPLAGMLSRAVRTMQRQAEHWLAQAEEQTVLDAKFGTLKAEWAKIRLEEEILRAGSYKRPLSVVLLQLEPSQTGGPAKPIFKRSERLGALQALVRLARSTTQPPAVVSYLGSNQVLLVLPEHNFFQASQKAADIQTLAATTVYFPGEHSLDPVPDDKRLGKPLQGWGQLRVGVAALDGILNAEVLLAQAKTELTATEDKSV